MEAGLGGELREEGGELFGRDDRGVSEELELLHHI